VLAGEQNIDLAVGVKTKTVQVRIMATFGLVTPVTYPKDVSPFPQAPKFVDNVSDVVVESPG